MTDHTISSDGKIERMIEERWCVPLGAGEPRCIKATGVSCVLMIQYCAANPNTFVKIACLLKWTAGHRDSLIYHPCLVNLFSFKIKNDLVKRKSLR